jgi:hypothetical protein
MAYRYFKTVELLASRAKWPMAHQLVDGPRWGRGGLCGVSPSLLEVRGPLLPSRPPLRYRTAKRTIQVYLKPSSASAVSPFVAIA